MSYQNVTGALTQGAHPGSYNGQDAYNDMLVIDENSKHRKRATAQHGDGRTGESSGLYARCPSNSDKREREREREMAESVVRRLTPLECERLQGMPDDWSRYGINEKGEVYELPDSARYRLQGNGIATPFWKYLLKRISAEYERDPTMGACSMGKPVSRCCGKESTEAALACGQARLRSMQLLSQSTISQKKQKTSRNKKRARGILLPLAHVLLF